jgi:hypothetical protein
MAPTPSKVRTCRLEEKKRPLHLEVDLTEVGVGDRATKSCFFWGVDGNIDVALNGRVEADGLRASCEASMAEILTSEHGLGKPRCPFHDLGADVPHEGGRAPAAQDHNFDDRLVGEEEGHGGAGSDRVGAYVRGIVTEDFTAASRGAGFAKDVDDILLVNKSGLWVFLFVGRWFKPGVDGCVGSGIGIIMEDATNDSSPESWRAHDTVVCARLGATFFLVSVLLVGEGDGDETDVSVKVFVERRDDRAPNIGAAKNNVADG